MKIRIIRYTLMAIVLGLVIYLALGYGQRTFEAYCPFGGVESLWGLFTAGEFNCALGALNLSMMVAVLILALLAKKSFCGWACPIGFIGEIFGRIGNKIFRKKTHPGPRLNNVLKLARYPLLAIFLYLTYNAAELIYRGYDPYYLIFSGFGHGSLGTVSYIVLGAMTVGAFLIPMFFCRYLCPLGAVLDPFSRVGLAKITRDEQGCTDCGLCQVSCPHDIPVQNRIKVRDRDCTNCLECIEACPEDGVLSLRANL